jgi:hypothetical protein
MPTLPLHLPADAVPAEASHRVTSPGGYEQWAFEAISTDGATRFLAIFYEGCPFDRRYARQYMRYRRRPTRTRPPMPSEYPVVYAALIERGRVLVRYMTLFPPGTCAASSEKLDVRIGPNHVMRDADGNIRMVMSGLEAAALAAELQFRPVTSSEPNVVPIEPGEAMEGEHYRVADPATFDVHGEIRLSVVGPGQPLRHIRFAGRGRHDHRFGSAPLISAFDRSLLTPMPGEFGGVPAVH